MIKRIGITLLLGLLFFAPLPASTAERGTAEEAQALAEKAIARYKEVGAEQTITEINTPGGSFVDRDLYVFVAGPDHKIIAHGADPGRVGDTLVGFKDVEGKAFGDEIIAASAEGNWVEYKFENFTNGKSETKTSFVKNVDGYIFGCGYYKP
jgi:signal transduction histidine kinase